MCLGCGVLSDKKALYESYMSQVRNNLPRRVFSLYEEIMDCAIELVDGAQYNVNVDLLFYGFLLTFWVTGYFSLSCELFGWLTISKYQALKIVYCSHGAAIEWGVGEGETFSWVGARTKGEVRECKLTKTFFLHSDFLKFCLRKNATPLNSSLTQLCFTIKNLCCEVMG